MTAAAAGDILTVLWQQRHLSQLRAGRCVLTADILYRFGSVTKRVAVPSRNGLHGLTLDAEATVTADRATQTLDSEVEVVRASVL